MSPLRPTSRSSQEVNPNITALFCHDSYLLENLRGIFVHSSLVTSLDCLPDRTFFYGLSWQHMIVLIVCVNAADSEALRKRREENESDDEECRSLGVDVRMMSFPECSQSLW